MTFGKFFLIVLTIYLIYYGLMLLIEKVKTQKAFLPINSKRVDFIVEQPKDVLSHEVAESTELEADEKKNKALDIEESAERENEEENNILDDLGIEAYFSNSIDVTEDNLLTLIHEER